MEVMRLYDKPFLGRSSNPHVRPLLSELAYRRRQDVGGHERRRAERYGLLIALGAAPDVRDRDIQLLEAPLNDGEEVPAVRGQLDVTRRAVEQPEPDPTFKLFDQHA